MTAEDLASAMEQAGPGAAEIVIPHHPEYRAVVSASGWTQVISPRPGSSYDCDQSDHAYLLLVERKRSDELADEVDRLREELAAARGAERDRCIAEADRLRKNADCSRVKKACSALIDRMRKGDE